MKYKRLIFMLVSVGLLFSACNKNQFKFDEFQGVQADGEMLLPIASGHYSMSDLMERFQMDSLIAYDPSGNMSYNFFLEQLGVIEGDDLLRFDDMTLDESYSFSNPMPGLILPFPVDTVLGLTQSIAFGSDKIQVLSAMMKSGRFDFDISSNFAEISKIEISSPEIKNADGSTHTFVYEPAAGVTGFDLSGLQYRTAEVNKLNFRYMVYGTIQDLSMIEFTFNVHIAGTDFSLREMSGYVEPYTTRSWIDTTFSIFPDNMSGTISLENVMVSLSERNTFGIDAKLVVDTALVWGDGVEPSFLLSPLPLEIDAVPSPVFTEVFHQPLEGSLSARSGSAYITSDFIVNPSGMMDLVSVTDDATVDMRVNVSVPFEFRLDDVHYVDTVNMRLSEIQSPEWIKNLTLELTFISTIPFNLVGNFKMYDSSHNEITDILLNDATLIAASFDGQPTTVNVPVEIDGDRLQRVMQSDRIILDFGLDTDGRDVTLNKEQNLDFYLKAKVDYDGVVNF